MSSYNITWDPCTVDLGKRIGTNIGNDSTLTSITFTDPILYTGPRIESSTTILSANFPNLTTIVKSPSSKLLAPLPAFTVSYNTLLTSLLFPKLTSAGPSFYILGNTALTTLDLSKLATIDRPAEEADASGLDVDISGNTLLTTLDLSQLVGMSNQTAGFSFNTGAALGDVGYFSIDSNPALTHIDMPKFVPLNGMNHLFDSNALDQATVDQIIDRFVANAGFVSGLLLLSGGTNSAPSAAGLLGKAILNGRQPGLCVTN